VAVTDETDGQSLGLTPALEMLWGTRDRPRRGPKPGLSVEKIVEAGIEIADSEGLGALSMGRIAKDLGFSTMSLYRYVPTKADLLVLMVNAAVEDPPDLVAEFGDDWRAGLELWTRANVGYLIRRPWIIQVAITGPPVSPKQLAWMESALAVLARTPLPPEEQLGVLQLLLVQSLGEARLAIDLVAAERAALEHGGVTFPSYGQTLRQLVDPARYPSLNAIVAAGVFDGSTSYEDEDFTFGLGRVLDGIGMLIEARTASS
jgi:AcrR family transcriptional regulator